MRGENLHKVYGTCSLSPLESYPPKVSELREEGMYNPRCTTAMRKVPQPASGGYVERTEQPERPQGPQFDPQPRWNPEPHVDQEPEPEVDGDGGKKRDHRATAWEIVETILLALLIFIMVRGVVLNFRVDGNSMEPTLTHSEMLIINRRAYTSLDINAVLDALPGVDRNSEDRRYLFNPPQRGDIVVFRPPGTSSDPYIKRIVGLPGETVEIREGAVFIDGNRLEENYVSSSTSWRGGGGSDQTQLTIPEDEYFMLGDNRENSSDSRSFGTVPKDDIIGKSWLAYWPPGSVQVFPKPGYANE
jgi:signal peptidase I